MKPANFTKLVCICLFISTISLFSSCKKNKGQEAKTEVVNTQDTVFFKLSLAQWSLNKSIRFEGKDPTDFAQRASELGFDGLEYVSQLYKNRLDSIGMDSLLVVLKAKSDKYKIENLIIMVDGEGNLASTDEKERDQAVENHKKWVDAAAYLGCHSIRVNTFGTNDPELWVDAATDGLRKLSQYAATKSIGILVENHGWLSSDAPKVVEVMKAVNMDNCGTLPDFGNWCVKRKDGEKWGECIEEYPDMYQGIQLLMPYAKAVSAKSYDFDENGSETKIDYKRMMQVVKDAGYDGYVGVEYEGSRLSEEEGIKATRDLLLKVAKELN
ncbi:MAG: sugar phosphate isomerase/epimerase family protein [Flavobacteriaceae bacterium]|nr:sugar phosphate isomerase/epimerase family protein [Flavobacteriaceae bacterium]